MGWQAAWFVSSFAVSATKNVDQRGSLQPDATIPSDSCPDHRATGAPSDFGLSHPAPKSHHPVPRDQWLNKNSLVLTTAQTKSSKAMRLAACLASSLSSADASLLTRYSLAAATSVWDGNRLNARR